ncbi:hypothetical protein ACFQFH_02705 [Halobaculum halobium]|uniref:Uncharacterized protein n=1 Tax=Halobaculum halobium TaxID=3032281 RepID=A0ABD5T5Z5_9EURY|nr:hypothetical protein [Halobaculum sp. SYNS20]
MSGATPETADDRFSDDHPATSGLYHVFVAFGFAGAEVGIALGLPLLAAIGLTMFGWSVAGMLGETGLLEATNRAQHVGAAGGVYGLAAAGLVALARPAGITLPQRELAFAAAAGALIAFAGYDAVRPDGR